MNDHLSQNNSSSSDEDLTQTSANLDPAETHTTAQKTAHGKPDMAMPMRIGPFTILSKIGEGGMGTVYEAEQDSPKRTVALKVIRKGLASAGLLKRFALESQVLGRLQHPGIAQVFQAGTAETEAGQAPYFAMEFVRGVDLRQFVRQNKLGIRARLKLLASICNAVHHAHQKGVIHRDLKPSNILVDESGQPKILDFGVARATDSDMQVTTMQTDVGQLIGTLQYMSPEQVAADPSELDTRSDVYALGVIAYELLTERMPYDLKNKMIHEIARIIREEEPTSPSLTNKMFRGDIETIVAKSLDKDKTRRYQSAAEFAEDIRRYLGDEPILARPPSAIYQLQKFAKRNKALAGGIAIAMVAMFFGLVTSTYLYLQADNARQGEQKQRVLAEQREAEAVAARAEAQERADELRTVTTFQQSMLSEMNAESMGRGILAAQRDEIRKALEHDGASDESVKSTMKTVEKLTDQINATNLALRVVDDHVLSQAAKTIDEQFGDQPATHAALQQSIAATYRELGLYNESMPLQRAALETRTKNLGDDDPDTLSSIQEMCTLLYSMDRVSEGEPYCRKALEGRRRILGNDHPDTLASITGLSELLYRLNRHEECLKLNREAYEGARRVLGEDHSTTLAYLNNIAVILQLMGRTAEARKYVIQAYEGQRRAQGDGHPLTLTGQFNVGFSYFREGNFEKAHEALSDALAAMRRVQGDKHPGTLFTMIFVGRMLERLGRDDEALRHYREAVAGSREVLGINHKDTLGALIYLCRFLNKQEQYEEAWTLLQRDEPAARRVWEARDSSMLAMYLVEQATAASGLGRYEQAQDDFLESYESYVTVHGAGDGRSRETAEKIAEFYESWHAAEPDNGYDAKAREWRAKATTGTTKP